MATKQLLGGGVLRVYGPDECAMVDFAGWQPVEPAFGAGSRLLNPSTKGPGAPVGPWVLIDGREEPDNG